MASDLAADAARTSRMYAVGADLDALGVNVVARAEGESDDSYRARMIAGDQMLTPTALLAALDTLLAPFGYSGAAYYNELPDDECFLEANSAIVGPTGALDASTNLNGAFIGIDGTGALVAEERRYDMRPRSEPRHVFIWGEFRQSTTRALGPAAGADYTDVFAANGHTVVGIPPFDFLDAEDGDDDAAYAQTMPAVVVDVSGNLTDDATDVVEASGALFDLSDETESAVLFSVGGDGTMVVLSLLSLLDQRATFPSTFTVVLDPELA
jgi:hypothetical protein